MQTSRILPLLLFSCFYALSSSFFDFLKSPSSTRQIENEAKQKDLRQKQILKEKVYQEQVKLFDSISKSRGIPPHLNEKYSGSTFTCDNGSKKISSSLVNDAFCDCADGSDEPGTSACSNGVFYCINSGYKLLSIPSSRVDDQICDCCDGSDEGILTKCANTCNEAAARERSELDRKTTAYRSGSKERSNLIDKIKIEKTTLASQGPELNAEIDRLNANKSEYSSKIKELDEVIQSRKSQRNSVLSDKTKFVLNLHQMNLEQSTQFLSSLLTVLNIDGHDESIFGTGHVMQDEVKPHEEYTEEEEQSHYGAEEIIEDGDVKTVFTPAVEKTESKSQEDSNNNQKPCEVLEFSKNDHRLGHLCSVEDPLAAIQSLIYTVIESKKAYSEPMLLLGFWTTRHTFAGSEEYARSHLASELADTCPMDLSEVPHVCAVKGLLSETFIQDSRSMQEVETLSAQLAELRQLESTLQNQINELTPRKDAAEQASKDLEFYADHLEYLALRDQCFEVNDGKFAYSLCMLGRVTQRELEGDHNSVVLGEFDSLEPTSDGQHMVMHFKRGQHCHAFGDRTADVTVQCGPVNTLSAASEPSTCYYAFTFHSPVACTPQFAYVNGILLP